MTVKVNRLDIQLPSKIKLYIEMQMVIEPDVAIMQAQCKNVWNARIKIKTIKLFLSYDTINADDYPGVSMNKYVLIKML